MAAAQWQGIGCSTLTDAAIGAPQTVTTAAKCIAACSSSSKTYAGLQLAGTSVNCFCWDSLSGSVAGQTWASSITSGCPACSLTADPTSSFSCGNSTTGAAAAGATSASTVSVYVAPSFLDKWNDIGCYTDVAGHDGLLSQSGQSGFSMQSCVNFCANTFSATVAGVVGAEGSCYCGTQTPLKALTKSTDCTAFCSDRTQLQTPQSCHGNSQAVISIWSTETPDVVFPQAPASSNPPSSATSITTEASSTSTSSSGSTASTALSSAGQTTFSGGFTFIGGTNTGGLQSASTGTATTATPGSNQNSTSSNSGSGGNGVAIIAGVVGGVVLLLIIGTIGAAFFLSKRNRDVDIDLPSFLRSSNTVKAQPASKSFASMATTRGRIKAAIDGDDDAIAGDADGYSTVYRPGNTDVPTIARNTIARPGDDTLAWGASSANGAPAAATMAWPPAPAETMGWPPATADNSSNWGGTMAPAAPAAQPPPQPLSWGSVAAPSDQPQPQYGYVPAPFQR